MNPLRQIIINADDLGLAPGVNRGITEVLAAGHARSTSLMVNLPAARDAIKHLARLGHQVAGISVGLHFNMVVGEPLTEGASLRAPRERVFRPLIAQLWRAWLGRLDLKDVEAELVAQLDRATELLTPLGVRVTHLDSHRHTHALPGIADVVRDVARRRGIAHVRHSFETGATLLGRPVARLKASALRTALGAGQPLDDVRFAGIALMASPTFDADMLAVASVVQPGVTELMVHPGYDCPELAVIDGYRAERENELRALTAPGLGQALAARGVQLSRFGASSTARAG